MTDEIIKLYENAGIKGEWRDYRVKNGKIYDGKNPKNRNIRLCKPRFTAEKQIELIKLLSYYYNITISKNFENDYKFQCEGDDVRPYVFTSGQDFAEQLAVFVNMCFEYLPEEEKQQIKEILNG